jgi:hypothetical protein
VPNITVYAVETIEVTLFDIFNVDYAITFVVSLNYHCHINELMVLQRKTRKELSST